MTGPIQSAVDPHRTANSACHLLIVTPGFPSDEKDDTCIPALQEYLRAFACAYPMVRITVIALHYPFTLTPYRWNGIDVIPLAGSNSILRKPLLWYRAIRQAQSVHRVHPASIVHSFWLGECAMVGACISQRTGAPHICTLMGQELRYPNRYASILRGGRTRFFALSTFQATDFQRRMGRQPDGVIPWGVDAGQYSSASTAPGPSGRDIDLLGVGSLIAVKNFPLFVTTAAAAIRTRPGLRCVIAGGGPDRAAIESLVRENGLEKSVTLTGMIPRHEVLALMRRSKILLHPSQYEGFGFVFAEALASGMQIVSFDVGSARAHPRWHIARDDAGFRAGADRALGTVADPTPVLLFPVSGTVDRYASAYGLSAGGGDR